MNPQLLFFSDEEWQTKSASYIHKAVETVCKHKGKCSVMLTGGLGAEMVYQAWSQMLCELPQKIQFYFGDERCVSPDDKESNYCMAVQSLFPIYIPDNFTINRIKGETSDKMIEANRYTAILPTTIDILLLSIGEDGHIASLFPGDSIVLNNAKQVLPVIAEKRPSFRFTISPGIIRSAKEKICFCKGKLKGAVLATVFKNVDDILPVPARIAYDATWLLDKSAAIAMKENQQSYS